MSKLNKSLFCAVVLGLFLAATSAQAAFLVPTEITASSRFGTSSQFSPSNLNDEEYTLTSATDMAVIPKAGDGEYFWVSGLRVLEGVTVTLDFGTDVEMSDFVLWNYVSDYPNDLDRGIQDFTLSFATDVEGETGFNTSIADTGTFTAAMGVDELADPEQSGNYGQVFDFADVSARYLRVNIQSHYGDTLFVGASEMRVSAVPEPGTILLLLSGLLGLGLIVKRRK